MIYLYICVYILHILYIIFTGCFTQRDISSNNYYMKNTKKVWKIEKVTQIFLDITKILKITFNFLTISK